MAVGIISSALNMLVGRIPSLNVVGKSVFAGKENAATRFPKPRGSIWGIGADVALGSWLHARSAARTERIEEEYIASPEQIEQCYRWEGRPDLHLVPESWMSGPSLRTVSTL